MKVRLAKVFNFYESYSKIFPNYIILPESKYLYKNIERKQKLIDELQNNEMDPKQKKDKDDSKLKEENRFFKTEICNLIHNQSISKNHIDFSMRSDFNNVNNTEILKFEDFVYGGNSNRTFSNLLREINSEYINEKYGENYLPTSLQTDINELPYNKEHKSINQKQIVANMNKKEDNFKKKEKNKKNELMNNKGLKLDLMENLKHKYDPKKTNTKKILQITKNKPSNLITTLKKENEKEKERKKENIPMNTINAIPTTNETGKNEFESGDINNQTKNTKQTPTSDKKNKESNSKTKKSLIISHKGALSMPKLSELDPSIFQIYNITNKCTNVIENGGNENMNYYGNINTLNTNNMNLQNNVIAKNVYIINNNSSDHSPMPRKIFERTPKKYKTTDLKKNIGSDSKNDIKYQTEISKSRIDKNLSNKFIKPNKREDSVRLFKSNKEKHEHLTEEIPFTGINTFSSQKKFFNMNPNKKVGLIEKEVKSLQSLKYKDVVDNSQHETVNINTSSIMKSQNISITKNSKLVSFNFNTQIFLNSLLKAGGSKEKVINFTSKNNTYSKSGSSDLKSNLLRKQSSNNQMILNTEPSSNSNTNLHTNPKNDELIFCKDNDEFHDDKIDMNNFPSPTPTCIETDTMKIDELNLKKSETINHISNKLSSSNLNHNSSILTKSKQNKNILRKQTLEDKINVINPLAKSSNFDFKPKGSNNNKNFKIIDSLGNSTKKEVSIFVRDSNNSPKNQSKRNLPFKQTFTLQSKNNSNFKSGLFNTVLQTSSDLKNRILSGNRNSISNLNANIGINSLNMNNQQRQQKKMHKYYVSENNFHYLATDSSIKPPDSYRILSYKSAKLNGKTKK